MDEKSCFICGDNIKKKLFYKMKCGHEAHYECIMISFKNDSTKLNQCPYCRNNNGLLPIVNGLKKIEYGIHCDSYANKKEIESKYENIKCQHILKTGKNKGNKCNNNCIIGFNFCGKHNN